jgi:hypothetical protein
MAGRRYAGCVTRHELLRAWLGVWIDHERKATLIG